MTKSRIAFTGKPLLLPLLIAMSGLALADNEAPITGVLLYPGGATIERTAAVSPGMTHLDIVGLPANFDTQTLFVQADSGVRVGRVLVRDINQADTVNARAAAIAAKIQALQDQGEALDVDAKSADLVRGYLEHVSVPGDDVAKGRAPLDGKAVASVVEALQHSGSAAFDTLRRVAQQKREINKQIEVLQQEQNKLGTEVKASRTVSVALLATHSGQITLSYQVNGAGWRPAYRASLDSAASSIELQRLATLSQHTGEDWSQVRLRLSTTQPRLSPRAPEPRTWTLSYQRPYPPAEARLALSPAAAAPDAYSMKSLGMLNAAEDAASYVAPVLENQGAFSTEYEVPGRVTLPADGRELSVAIGKQELAAKQVVRVVPRQEHVGVLTATAARPTGVWLPGDMQLYRDGSYVGANAWNPQGTEPFVFSFGRDDLVRVAVEHAPGFTGSTGLFAGGQERRVADIYTVTSQHRTPIDVLVLESSPVSTSDEVRVKSEYRPQPGLSNWEQHQGVVGWSKSLAPSESLTLNVAYTINYPKEGSVQGLP